MKVAELAWFLDLPAGRQAHVRRGKVLRSLAVLDQMVLQDQSCHCQLSVAKLIQSDLI